MLNDDEGNPAIVPIFAPNIDDDSVENVPIVDQAYSGSEIVLYDQAFAIQQILENLHSSSSENVLVPQADMDPFTASPTIEVSLYIASSTLGRKKRRAKAKTPVVDDEVRSARLQKNAVAKLVQLDSEPRRRGEKKIDFLSLKTYAAV